MAQQITYDKAYDTVAPEDFAAMLEVPRYGRRSDAFDSIISATHDHFWDPLDKSYIDFDQPFDMTATPVMPLDTVVELRSAATSRASPATSPSAGATRCRSARPSPGCWPTSSARPRSTRRSSACRC